MKKTLKLFIGACLATCAITASAQSLVANGGFDAGDATPVTADYVGQTIPSGIAGWDVVSGNAPVFTNRANIGMNGSGDTSIVVYDEGQQGGISQNFVSDAPYLRVTANVFVQYGSACLAAWSPDGNLGMIDGTDNPNQWVTLSGVVPNVQGPNVVQVLSGDSNGSAFAVDNVVVEPIYDETYGGDATFQSQDWQPQNDFEAQDNGYDVPMYEAPVTFSPETVVNDQPDEVTEFNQQLSELRNLASLYEMANGYGQVQLPSNDIPYFPSVYGWP